MKTFRSCARLSVVALALFPLVAAAGTPVTEVPEPGTWALVALAGAIGVLVARNKRK